MKSEKAIGENIRKIRKSKKMTMKELGEKIGVSEQAIGNYERGDREPTIDVLIKISDALEVSLFDILGDKIDKKQVALLVNYLNKTNEEIRNTYEKQIEINKKINSCYVKENKILKDYKDTLENKMKWLIDEPIGIFQAIILYMGLINENMNDIKISIYENEEDLSQIEVKENKYLLKENQVKDIVKKVCDLVEFELYKIKNNK